MVWKPQYRAGLQCHLGRWRYFKLWTHRVGNHKRRAGIALDCRCWFLNQGHGQGDRNTTLLTVCLERTAGTETELKSTCRWGKGAGRKPGFQPYAKQSLQQRVLQITARLGWWPPLFCLLNTDKCARITGSSKRGFGFVAQQLGGTDLCCCDSFPKNTCVSSLTVQEAQGDQLDVDVPWRCLKLDEANPIPKASLGRR